MATGLFRQTLAGHAASYAALSLGGPGSSLTGANATGAWPTQNWGQMAKTVFAPTIAAGQLISGIGYANTPQGQADRNMSFALTYMDNGGGWSGAWAALNVSFNPMYGAITAGFNAYDSFSAGNYGDGLVNAFTAIDITALTGASTLGALRAGGGTVGVAANSEAAAVNGVPKTSPNFKPPTNAPQLPPSEIPAG